jgi:hypothetical protein
MWSVHWRRPAEVVSHTPVLSSERMLHINKPAPHQQACNCLTGRSGLKPQMGALFQDRLAD